MVQNVVVQKRHLRLVQLVQAKAACKSQGKKRLRNNDEQVVFQTIYRRNRAAEKAQELIKAEEAAVAT